MLHVSRNLPARLSAQRRGRPRARRGAAALAKRRTSSTVGLFTCTSALSLAVRQFLNPQASDYSLSHPVKTGYSKKVKGNTVEERLDMRCARKTDKFCK